MKHIHKKHNFILLILISTLAVSCSDILDLAPISSTQEENFWLDNNDANLGVVGIYDALQKNYRENQFYWGEFRSDNFITSLQTNALVTSLIENKLDPNQPYVQWDKLYTMIFRANKAISKIPLIENYEENLLGEAHALRAYAYFDAYRLWGDVPLITEAALILEGDYLQARAPKSDVLALVLSDMTQAESLITTEKSDYRFSKASVLAFKARVYMHLAGLEDDATAAQGYYTTAKTTLDALIAMDLYRLTTTQEEWRNLFINDFKNYPGQGQEGPELILSINYDLSTDGSSASRVARIFRNGVPTNYINEKFIEKWKLTFPDDWRYTECVDGTKEGERVCSKYQKDNIASSIDDTNIILFRYADMLLLLAEAENQLGDADSAIGYLNEIREARGLDPEQVPSSLSKEEIEDLILDERRFELFAEGLRWWDLVRTGKAQKKDDNGDLIDLNEEQILWPIYFRHLIDNDKLEQNANY